MYTRPSLRLNSRVDGHSSYQIKAPRVLRQSTRCSGVLSHPHEQVSIALVWLSLQWYQAKSPCVDRIERSLAKIALGRSSSAGLLRGA
jgi:hypothetical protein